MEFLREYGKEIFSGLVAIVVWALGYFLKAKPRLSLAQPHAFTYLVDEPITGPDGTVIQPRQTVHTSTYWVQNSGRDTATRVELVFNAEPKCLNIWPVRSFLPRTLPDNRYVLIFDSLAPGEVLSCHVLNVNHSLPDLIYVRCDQGAAKIIEMRPQVVASAARIRLAIALMILGVAGAFYLALLLLQFLILRTPYGH
jgi:hypothetical protein